MVSIYSQMSYIQFNTLLSPLFLGFEWTSNKVDFISNERYGNNEEACLGPIKISQLEVGQKSV